jgi:DNA-binding transcriptional ArsR family regulator
VNTYPHVLDALGDPTRRAILERLADQPSAVVDLAAVLPVSRPAVSQHLKVLKGVRLVRDDQVGTRRIYSLDPVGLAGLRDYLERFWGTALGSFKARVEDGTTTSGPDGDTTTNTNTNRNTTTNTKSKTKRKWSAS